MPATTRVDDEPEVATDQRVDGEQPTFTVTDHLDQALAVAREENMSASELMGLFFYYAHSIAESYRQDALRQDGGG